VIFQSKYQKVLRKLMNTLNERSKIKEDYELGERPPLGTVEP
jgi:hypothetical protein